LNRTLSLLLVATATVGSAAAVAAATPANTSTTTATTSAAPGGHWRHHHQGGGMLVGVMLRATRQLNLTSEQQTAIGGILSRGRARPAPIEPATRWRGSSRRQQCRRPHPSKMPVTPITDA